MGISSRSHSLTSIISSISEDEDGTASLDFSTVSLDTAIVSAAARAMTFSAEVQCWKIVHITGLAYSDDVDASGIFFTYYPQQWGSGKE